MPTSSIPSSGFLPVVRLPQTAGLSIDTQAPIVPGSIVFTWHGDTFIDRGLGVLYRSVDPETGSGIEAGTIDYDTGAIRITSDPGGAGDFALVSGLAVQGKRPVTEMYFRTTQAPIKPESVSIFLYRVGGDSETITPGPSSEDLFQYAYGTAHIDVDYKFYPDTARYNAIAFSYLPLDPEILGIDPVRMPSDGRVPIYHDGDVILVMHPQELSPGTITDGQVISFGRTRIAYARVKDADGATVSGDLYTLDRAAGTMSFPDVSTLAQPITIRHVIADLVQITDAQLSGLLPLSRELTHDYPADESYVASCLILGDRYARVSKTFDQATWTNVWSDTLIGSEATGTLNLIDFPITVTNEGADTDRWILRFLTSTTAELISEKRGKVWSGAYTSESEDIAPINPRTRTKLLDGSYVGGVPYMIIPAAANGGGWSAGNVVRINTEGAIADICITRSTQQSPEPEGDGEDGCEIIAFGNVNRP